MENGKLKVENAKAKVKRLPIWKTAKHGTEVVSKITLPHAEDVFTAQHMMADALPFAAAIVSLEVKYVMFRDVNDARRLGDECWKEYIDDKMKVFKKGGAK